MTVSDPSGVETGVEKQLRPEAPITSNNFFAPASDIP